MTGEETLTILRSTYPDLDKWQRRVRQIEMPEPGSELESDNTIFAHHLISEIARVSLASAGEHLRMARGAIEQSDYYPSAHFTTLRGALIGGAQAVWILGPDDSHTRQQRGLTVLAEIYKQLGRHYHKVAGLTSTTASEQAALADQTLWLIGRQHHVDRLLATKGWNLTKLIEAAIDHTFPNPPQRDEGRILWQQMSSDSHILGWSMLQRAKLGKPDPQTGLVEAQAGGLIGTIAQPFMLGKILLDEGWKRFDQRIKRPVSCLIV